MKKLIYLSLAIFFMAGTNPAEAQFFKKLKEKVEKKVEDAATKNISDKAAEETDKSLNNLWEKQLANSDFQLGMDMVDPSEIPDSYNFDWEYTLEMNTSQGEMDMVYLINEDEPYLGIKLPQAENMITVLDNKNKLTVMFMNSDGNKMVMANRNDISNEDINAENPYKDMEYKEIGTKTILGYECQGYRSENEDHVFEFYVTDEAGVSFSDLYQQNQKNIPKGFDADWLEDGLMMEMHMKDKKDPQKNVTMTCTGIEKKPFSIHKSEYKGMNIGGR